VKRNNVVTRFNEYDDAVDNGTAAELDPPRRESVVSISTPPFYALEAVPGITDASGALVVDADARVMTRFDWPIPRLYAAGADGPRFFTYDHGGLIGALTTGRVAGRNAAGEEPC
jgi:hypothetical protein